MLLREIKAAVATSFGVSIKDLDGPRRFRRLAKPRFAYWWVARQATKSSLPALAKNTGGRDHTTVMHGLEKASILRERDAEFREKTDKLRMLFDQ